MYFQNESAELLIKRVSLEVGISCRLLETEADIVGRIRDVSKETRACK